MHRNGEDRLLVPAIRMQVHLLPWLTASILALMLGITTGCNRATYRRHADGAAYCIVSEKGAGPTWALHPGFTIEPDARSRFYDPTCPTDPLLPIPAPQLYNYDLPPLATSPPKPRQLASHAGNSDKDKTVQLIDLPPPPDRAIRARLMDGSLVDPDLSIPSNVVQASSARQGSTSPEAVVTDALLLDPAHSAVEQDPGTGYENVEALPAPKDLLLQYDQGATMRLPPVPAEAWQSLPGNCVMRMLEFENVRAEYERTFQQAVTESQLDPAERINLENILEIALINSRDYQTRKEALYRTALRLSLTRFNYDLKFLRRGNSISPLYNHNRSGGIEVNRLSIPSNLGITRSLYTAGELVARVSNDIVMTFNGSSGYSSSIGSEIFIDLAQPLIQRDIQFEPLTQTERDVVYAARDFVQVRKQLFRDLAVQYFNLLLTYRSIAINTQDYFSNLDGFNRSVAYYNAGRIPRVQVDQFEQNVLNSSGNLINSCNALEQALDRLKLRVGLPPELPLNLDLSELETLTASDEATVVREQIRKERVIVQQQLSSQDPSVTIPAAVKLASQMLSLVRVNLRLGLDNATISRELEILVAVLEAEDKRIAARTNAQVLQEDPNGETRILPAQVFLRKSAVIETTLSAIQRELKLLDLVLQNDADQVDSDAENDGRPSQLEQLIKIWQQRIEDFQEIREAPLKLPNAERLAHLPDMIARAELLLASIQQLDSEVVSQLRGKGIVLTDVDSELLALAESAIGVSEREDFVQSPGLMKLEVDMDEAMMTALVQRLDLMNQRGRLADAWRQIKYAGDDLKSILNLRATQSIRTPSGSNNPLDFSFDDSTTTLGLQFDSPLNRRTERNTFRFALINYNLALRNLIEAQDNVKFAIRNDIRAIALDQNQYQIAIASAALAYDRVNSTRMQLVAQGSGNVSARDFLEAQQAYTRSLSSVAQQHIGYIVDRITLFLELEQLQVDPMNFWTELRNEEYPFIPNMDFPAAAPDAYGRLPYGPWYSDCLRRMEKVPPGQSVIHRHSNREAN